MACQFQIFFIILLFMPSTPAKKAPPSNNTRIDQFFRPINNSQTNNSTSETNPNPSDEEKIQPTNQSIAVEPVTNPSNSEPNNDVKMEEEDSDKDDEIIHINYPSQQQHQTPPLSEPPPPSQFCEEHLEYLEIPPENEDFTYTFQYKRYVNMPFMIFDDKKQRVLKVEEWRVFKKIICSNYSNKSEIINVFNRLGQPGIAISFII